MQCTIYGGLSPLVGNRIHCQKSLRVSVSSWCTACDTRRADAHSKRARAGTPPCLIRDSSPSAAALLSVILLYAALAPVGTGATHTMSGSLWKQLLTRGSSWIEPSASPEAWETTAELRRKLLYTHLNALPARWQAAQNEFRALMDKMRAKQVTIEEAGWFGVRCVELYAFYCLGVVIGARSLQP